MNIHKCAALALYTLSPTFILVSSLSKEWKMHQEFDSAGIQTHNLRIMNIPFYATEMYLLTTEPSVTFMRYYVFQNTPRSYSACLVGISSCPFTTSPSLVGLKHTQWQRFRQSVHHDHYQFYFGVVQFHYQPRLNSIH